MKRWTVEVVETVLVSKLYTVEADTLFDALQAAYIGQTVEEFELRTHGVTDREVIGECEEVKEGAK